MNYTKQPLDYSQIIQQLKSRGLLFHDDAAAENELKIVSYFRIANYLYTFEVPNSNHTFLPNSYFEDALRIYYFDKDLRGQWKFSGDKHKSLQVDTERTFHQRYPLVML